jgi:putative FmdB family regulatory protein
LPTTISQFLERLHSAVGGRGECNEQRDRNIWVEEIAMPYYVFACLDCGKEFTEILHIADLSVHQAKCPFCGSVHVEQQAATFTATTSKKS